MPKLPYSQFRREEMILRDHLANDRTVLANERTFLAYLRTTLAFCGAGVVVIKVFPDGVAGQVIGWALIPMGVAVLGIGLSRFLKCHRALNQLREEPDPDARPQDQPEEDSTKD